VALNKITISFPDKMIKRVKELAKKWNVSEGEVMRRIFGVGDFVIRESENGAKIYAEGGKEKVKLVVPF